MTHQLTQSPSENLRSSAWSALATNVRTAIAAHNSLLTVAIELRNPAGGLVRRDKLSGVRSGRERACAQGGQEKHVRPRVHPSHRQAPCHRRGRARQQRTRWRAEVQLSLPARIIRRLQRAGVVSTARDFVCAWVRVARPVRCETHGQRALGVGRPANGRTEPATRLLHCTPTDTRELVQSVLILTLARYTPTARLSSLRASLGRSRSRRTAPQQHTQARLAYVSSSSVRPPQRRRGSHRPPVGCARARVRREPSSATISLRLPPRSVRTSQRGRGRRRRRRRRRTRRRRQRCGAAPHRRRCGSVLRWPSEIAGRPAQHRGLGLASQQRVRGRVAGGAEGTHLTMHWYSAMRSLSIACDASQLAPDRMQPSTRCASPGRRRRADRPWVPAARQRRAPACTALAGRRRRRLFRVAVRGWAEGRLRRRTGERRGSGPRRAVVVPRAPD